MTASRPYSPLSLCFYICFHFSLCVWQTAKKFQTVVVLSQQPLLQLSLGRMARVSHLIMNALPGSRAWGRFSGGTVETWSGEVGSIQLNLSMKPQEPGHNNTIMIVWTEEKQHCPTCFWSVESNQKKVAEKQGKFREASGALSWQINWTDGKGKRHSLYILSPCPPIFSL